MRRFMKMTVVFTFGAMLLLAAASCSKLDVVGKESTKSFEAVLNTVGDKVTTDDMTGGWMLPAPDDSAAFIWAPDYSTSGLHDVMLVYDMQPFIDAGLSVEKLPESFTIIEDKIMVGTKLGSDVLKYSGNPTPLASYEHIVNLYRDIIGYHTALDHFGVTVADGTMFEWAKDMSKNDKDIVFVLNPEPLIEAGVNPDAVEGWVYAKVPVEMNGKATEVYKFLKPFDLQ